MILPWLPVLPAEIYRRICALLPCSSALNFLLVNRFLYKACNVVLCVPDPCAQNSRTHHCHRTQAPARSQQLLRNRRSLPLGVLDETFCNCALDRYIFDRSKREVDQQMRLSAGYDLINSTVKRDDVRFQAYCCGSVIAHEVRLWNRQWLLLYLRRTSIYHRPPRHRTKIGRDVRHLRLVMGRHEELHKRSVHKCKFWWCRCVRLLHCQFSKKFRLVA